MRGRRQDTTELPSGAATRRAPAKRAKMIDDATVREIAFSLSEGPFATRNLVMFYLSHFCGLRAQEIAGLQWDQNVLDAKGRIGKTLFIGGDIGKYGCARTLDIPQALRLALITLREDRPRDRYVVYRLDGINDRRPTETQLPLLPNSVAQFFRRLYESHGLIGCSSHSGRRGFITKSSRVLAKTGKHSMADVQEMAGHANLNTTMIYLDPNPDRAEAMQDLWEPAIGNPKPRRVKVAA